MKPARVLYFDCSSGASGDMIVGALIDAGAPFDQIRAGLDSLGVSHLRVSAEKVVKRGISSTRFHVDAGDEHDHPHRHLADVLAIIERGELPPAVKDAAAHTFKRIAECEAKIHGSTPDKVHFHEVGAVDSIADIVAAHLAFHLLGAKRAAASPLNVGSGTVKIAHGIVPSPAPATAMLLEGAKCYGSDTPFELVTPTGAALIRQWAEAFGPMPPMTIVAAGYGCGTRELEDRANVLRAIVGEEPDVSGAGHGGEMSDITVIEVNIDDMNPELLPPLIGTLLEGGARDAFLTPILGKKGRPAHMMTVLCDAAAVAEISRIVFEGTSTFGLRLRREQRICLEREWKTASTPWGGVRVKVGRYEGRAASASPEFEDCRRLAEQSGVPVIRVYDAARAAAVKGELTDA